MTGPEPGLFEEPFGVAVIADRFAGMGADARRTARNVELLAAGIHPLTRLPLHVLAAPNDDRSAAGARCDTCVALLHGRTGHNGFLKCARTTQTNGPATDARRWWPACRLYEERT